jgi:hypothetical protein
MSPEDQNWLDNPRNVNKVVYALYAICALLVGADLFLHKHIHFEYENHFYNFENWFGFFGCFGFVACVGLVLAAKLLRVVVIREEDYYDQ